MKKCPTCNRTFTDDALSFCLDDGSSLLSVGVESGPPSYDPGATIQYNPASGSSPPPPSSYTPSQTPGYQSQPPAWAPTPPPGGMQGGPPKKKSKGIYWVIGIVAAVVVLGIGGIILVLVLIGMSDSNTNNGNANNSNTTENRNTNTNANNSNSDDSNKNSNSSSSKTYVAQDDFSATKWWVGSNAYGKAEYVNGEYQLTGGSAGGYVAVYGPKDLVSLDATTRVTAHSITGVSPPLGYGLTVFGEITAGQLDDYGFLIRTGDNPAFRVVSHRDGSELVLVAWTSASQIRTGSSSNQLEVRVGESKLEFYINGQFATSITRVARDDSGVAGVYTSGLSPIAFDDMEIYK